MKEDDQSERPVTASEFFAVHRLPGVHGAGVRLKCRMLGGEHVCSWEPPRVDANGDESDETELDEPDDEESE